MNARRLKGFLVAASALLVFAACGTKETKDTSASKPATEDKKETMSLSFGAMPAVDSLPLYIAEKEGFFTEEGLDLDLQAFKSPKDRDAALTSGHLNGANSDLIAVSTYYQGELPFKVTSQSTGTFSILTNNSDINTLADLKDKTAGYAKNQAPYYFLDKALQTEGLNVSDVGFQEVPQIPVRLELVSNEKIDATVLPEPFRTIGLAHGLKELGNSNDLDIQSTVFGFTQDTIDTNRDAIDAFYRAYNKGVDYLNSHEIDDYYDVLVEKIGFPEEMKEQVTLPEYKHAEQVASKQLTDAFEWSSSEGILSKEWKESDILSDVLNK